MTRHQFTIVLMVNSLALLAVAALLAFVIVDQMKQSEPVITDVEPEQTIDSTGLPILWTVPPF
ncbi:MAG: hypothetical protein KatS3mg104_1681 [Phycisphaerae bacterium]|nr:MAG: hypothetical protein KatS3mg104_1681 [Phycisphaerae bacterium]